MIGTTTSKAPDISGTVNDLARIAGMMKRPAEQANRSGTAAALLLLHAGESMLTGGPHVLACHNGRRDDGVAWNSRSLD